jgi:hypothetical protein
MKLKNVLNLYLGFFVFFGFFQHDTFAQSKKKPPSKRISPKKSQKKTPEPAVISEKSTPTAEPLQKLPPPAENAPSAYPDASQFEKSQMPSPFVRWSLFLNGGLSVPGQADTNPRIGYGGGIAWPIDDSLTMGLGFIMSKETRVSDAETFQFDTYTARMDFNYWFRSPTVEGLSMGLFGGWSQIRYRLSNGLTQTLSVPVNRTNRPLLFGGKLGWDWGIGNTLSLGTEVLYGFYLPSVQLNAFQIVDIMTTLRVRF